jgi:hypothetical protein
VVTPPATTGGLGRQKRRQHRPLDTPATYAMRSPSPLSAGRWTGEHRPGGQPGPAAAGLQRIRGGVEVGEPA